MHYIRRYFYRLVLASIIAGALFGWFYPAEGQSLKPIADGFIEILKRLIPLVIFCTVVLGFLQGEKLKKIGKVGLKAILYFEVVSTFALALGLIVGNIFQPGANISATSKNLDLAAAAGFADKAKDWSFQEFLIHLLPKNIWQPFAPGGDLIQVFIIAVAVGILLGPWSARIQPLVKGLQKFSDFLFQVVSGVMLLAPFAAGSAMAFTVGKYGTAALLPLMYMMTCFYGTCLVFIFLVLGGILRLLDVNIFKFLNYLRDELLTVLGTSSSESALAPLMKKLEHAGCKKAVVSFVVPTGYSFNLDGTNIYLTLSVLFLSQAMHVDISLQQQLVILGIGMLTSKGAAGVTGAGFVTLAATLTAIPQIPLSSIALLLGIDRFMSEARAITNIIGNAVATLVIANSEQGLDKNRLHRVMHERTGPTS